MAKSGVSSTRFETDSPVTGGGRDGGSGWWGTVAPARPAEPVGLTQPATRRMWARTLLVLVACIALFLVNIPRRHRTPVCTCYITAGKWTAARKHRCRL